MTHKIHTLDLHFQDIPGAIAAYLIPYAEGTVLVECGPGSTVPALEAGLANHGLTLDDVTELLVTHIHLDHAGAAGRLARHGATVYVHHVGAPHLRNPEKLLASATRIYGDDMERLWGECLPVPGAQLVELYDGDEIIIGDLHFEVYDTPGHAYHHMAILLDNVCFSGDVGGVRMLGTKHVALPMPPPEIHLEHWRESITTLRHVAFTRIAPTHFGIYEDVDWHLDAVERALDETEEWIEKILPNDPPIEELRERVTEWMRERALADGMSPNTWERHETANPSWMAAGGLRRYWRKHHRHAAGSDSGS